MFTGLVEEIGHVAGAVRAGDGMNLTVRASGILAGTARGDSICVNGACQTVTAVDDRSFTVFVSSVTLSVTTLGGFAPGRRVNLERAMTPSSRFGGHFVQGHVDGRGKVDRVARDASGLRAVVGAPPELRRYLVVRGSIAVDGISLTLVSLVPDGFTLYLVPETLAGTAAADWKPGDEVNIEVDIIAKYVERMMTAMKPGRGGGDDRELMKKLMEEGFT